MGKSNKPGKWFKAVKKAFRSPSKERPASPDHHDSKGEADEKLLLSKQYDHSPVRHIHASEPTPHPLPSFEIITHEEAEPPEGFHSRAGQQHNFIPQPLPTPEAVDPAIAIANHSEKAIPENVIEEEEHTDHSAEVQVGEEKLQQQQQVDDDDDSISEEEEAAARIQQRFSEPLALNGLIRLQALARGHQVRRQAATTLTTMEAIVRVQSVFRGRRVRMSRDGRAVRSRISKRRRLSSRAGLHVDASRTGLQFSEPLRFDQETTSKNKRPTAYLFTRQLRRSAPNRSSLCIDCEPGQANWGWAWLELWSDARPWEIRTVVESSSNNNSKDFIEIIPSSRKNNSEYTTKEVDVNTLKVKYYEDYVSNPTPPAKYRSSNPVSEPPKAQPPMYEMKKEPSIVKERKEPTIVKLSSPMSEKKEPSIVKEHREPNTIVKLSSPMSEKKEPSIVKEHKEPNITVKHSSPMSEKKEPTSVRSSVEKKEPFRSSFEKKEPSKPTRASSSPKQGPAAANKLPEKKESVRTSRSSSSSSRASLTSPQSEKKGRSSPSSPFSSVEKKASEPYRSPSRSFSSEKKVELSSRSPSSPLSTTEKNIESDFVAAPDYPPTILISSPTPAGRVLSKPPPIEVPAAIESTPVQVFSEPRTPEPPKSPARETSPAVSENSLPIPPSPQASDTSLPVPETPPGLDSIGDDPSITMEDLHLPEAAQTSNGATTEATHSSASNDEHLGTPSALNSTSEVGNGHASNGGTHQENGDSSKSPKVENHGESPGVPSSKRPTCRYMVPTESAKAKFRSSSNPKTRAPDTPESPVRTTPKRYSIGSSPPVVAMSKGTDSPKTAFGTRKTQSFQHRGTPSPKAGTPKEKPRSVETGAESPARRNSIGGDKRWRT